MIYYRPEGCTIRNGFNWHFGSFWMFIIKAGRFSAYLGYSKRRSKLHKGWHWKTREELKAEREFNLQVYGQENEPTIKPKHISKDGKVIIVGGKPMALLSISRSDY